MRWQKRLSSLLLDKDFGKWVGQYHAMIPNDPPLELSGPPRITLKDPNDHQ